MTSILSLVYSCGRKSNDSLITQSKQKEEFYDKYISQEPSILVNPKIDSIIEFKTKFELDSITGEMIEKPLFWNHKNIYTYDTMGKNISYVHYSNQELSSQFYYFYDNKGHLVKQESYNAKGKLQQTILYVFEKDSIYEEQHFDRQNIFQYYTKDSIINDSTSIEYQFAINDSIISQDKWGYAAEFNDVTSPQYGYIFDSLRYWTQLTVYEDNAPKYRTRKEIIYRKSNK